jgi:hypothetical protein
MEAWKNGRLVKLDAKPIFRSSNLPNFLEQLNLPQLKCSHFYLIIEGISGKGV